MRKKSSLRIAFIAGLQLLTASVVVGQTPDEDAIKKTIRSETEAYYKGNGEGWEATWLHDPSITRTIISQSSYNTTTGWSSFGPATAKALTKSKPTPIELKSENYIIRVSGDLAWVEYDQYINVVGGDPNNRRFSREYRVLAKQDGGWKIASQITTDPETFNLTSKNIEASLNQMGYNLMGAQKVKEAIEVLKVNVTLYPNSANVYDSLGEAYALDGNKVQAIKNYEKAIELDPKREGSKAALAKLKP